MNAFKRILEVFKVVALSATALLLTFWLWHVTPQEPAPTSCRYDTMPIKY